MEKIHQEIFASLKEHLWHRWGPTQPEEQEQGSAGTSGSDPQSDFQWRMQVTYDYFRNRQQESCKEALRVARDSYHQVLAAATLLEGHIKRMNCSISQGWSASHGQLGSHWHSHSRRHTRSHRRHLPVNQKELVPSVGGCPGDSAKMRSPSPNPVRPRKQVTFQDSSPRRNTKVKQVVPSTSGNRQSLKGYWFTAAVLGRRTQGLGYPPELDPQALAFLSGAGAPYTGDDDDSDWCSMQEPPYDNSNEWVTWHTCQCRDPSMWPNPWKVPNQRDTVQFTKWIQASFQMPRVRYLTLKMENDYSVPPAPHCLERDAFLPLSAGNFSSQDYRMKQTQKTLAYAKALQFWVEKAQPPQPSQPHQLAVCMHELRESMEPLTSFTMRKSSPITCHHTG